MHRDFERRLNRLTKNGALTPFDAAAAVAEKGDDPVATLAKVWERSKKHGGFVLSQEDRRLVDSVEWAGDSGLWSVVVEPSETRTAEVAVLLPNGTDKAFYFHKPVGLLAPNLSVTDDGCVGLWQTYGGAATTAIIIPPFENMHHVLRCVSIVPYLPEEDIAGYPADVHANLHIDQLTA